ncbi:hypothetical protein ETB97_008109 [Aspergillus alliaceus]|uniref:Uncharacterized protein n=1 Tax=Petromyces alliaceus TaxID=209559 RepID=A0A8H6E2M3_PETAA|nr:hypothetical protein ETB97_008109 [Aspergillus burnettii]
MPLALCYTADRIRGSTGLTSQYPPSFYIIFRGIFNAIEQAVPGIRVLSPDRQLIASDSDDRTIKLWDSATGAPQTLIDHSGSVTAVTFSPDGR